MNFAGQDGATFKGDKSGRLYLTTHRMIFNNKNKSNPMQSFSFPFVALKDVGILCILYIMNSVFIVDPRGRPVVIRLSVRPKTSKSNENHCRSGLWAGRVDHWWHTCFVFITLTRYSLQVELEQPIFGANFIKGKVRAQPNGNFVGEAKFKLYFKSGGAIDFGQAMLRAAQMGRKP